MSRRYLITGAQGFVGRYLVAHLLNAESGAEILGIGRSPASDDRFTHAVHWGAVRLAAPLPRELDEVFSDRRYRYAAVDLRQRAELTRVIKDYRPEAVFHLAAALRDDPPESLFRINVEGTIHLIEAIAESAIERPRLIFGSSGGVYGIPHGDALPLGESHPCRPIDFYSISKLAAEQAAWALARLYKIPLIVTRLFNLVGPGQDERHACGKFASTLAAIAANQLPRQITVGALATTRDFLDVRDAAAALHLLSERGEAGAAYNVGSGNETGIGAVLAIALRAAGLAGSVEVRAGANRALDIPRHFADIRRLKALGFRPRLSLERSIEDLFRYYFKTVADSANRAALGRRGKAAGAGAFPLGDINEAG
ncbi:MAG TPA: NAD-dependent epimerase/dehydratase family protein [Blastocatellia bacterium]|nr:NAD-dependent epimerase/dehydratase family protein [Blastocatellia bacterium]